MAVLVNGDIAPGRSDDYIAVNGDGMQRLGWAN